MTYKAYAGIGSRETPPLVLSCMQGIAYELALMKWTLRSGRAVGADQAFETGARNVKGKCEIYLPNMHNYKSMPEIIDQGLYNPKDVCYNDELTGSVEACKLIARLVHPNGKNLNPEALELHARNTYQILGYDLNTPAKFVVCWTKDGEGKGGTGQAIRLANLLHIPIIDLGQAKNDEQLYHLVNYVISQYGSLE